MVHIFSALKVFEKVLPPLARLSYFRMAAMTQEDFNDTKFGKVEKIVEFHCLPEFCDIHSCFSDFIFKIRLIKLIFSF